MLKPSLLLILLILFIPIALSGYSPVLREIHEQLRQDESFSLSFQQTTYTAALNRKTNSQGKLSYLFPNLSRWDYTTPDEQSIIINSNELQFIDPVLETFTIKKIQRAERNSALTFLSGSKDLYKDFEEIDEGSENFVECENKTLFVQPKDKEDIIKEIHICYDGSHHFEKISVLETNGNYRLFQFFDLNKTDKDYTKFQFKMPQGWELIKESTLPN